MQWILFLFLLSCTNATLLESSPVVSEEVIGVTPLRLCSEVIIQPYVEVEYQATGGYFSIDLGVFMGDMTNFYSLINNLNGQVDYEVYQIVGTQDVFLTRGSFQNASIHTFQLGSQYDGEQILIRLVSPNSMEVNFFGVTETYASWTQKFILPLRDTGSPYVQLGSSLYPEGEETSCTPSYTPMVYFVRRNFSPQSTSIDFNVGFMHVTAPANPVFEVALNSPANSTFFAENGVELTITDEQGALLFSSVGAFDQEPALLRREYDTALTLSAHQKFDLTVRFEVTASFGDFEGVVSSQKTIKYQVTPNGGVMNLDTNELITHSGLVNAAYYGFQIDNIDVFSFE